MTNRAGGKRRKLNQPLIKSIIVFLAATGASIGSAVTGIGAHLGFAPMLTWMFGYAPEKAQGTALRFSIVAAITTIVVYCELQGRLLHSIVNHPAAIATAFSAAELHGHVFTHLLRGVILVIGATIGAVSASPITPKPTATGLLRTLQAIAVIVSIFTITEATHLSTVAVNHSHYALFTALWQLLLLGIAAGAITQAGRLTGGVLLVPTLFFLTAMPDAVHGLRPLTASEAVIESLIVVLIAGLLPLWGYSQKGFVASTYLTAATLGGLIGGFAGGWLLTLLLERTILIFFGVVAMFFAAREIARLATSTPVETSDAEHLP